MIRRSTLEQEPQVSPEEGTESEAGESSAPSAARNQGSTGGVVEKLRGKLELKATSASQGEAGPRPELSPNLDRLTVGVDWGDRWSHHCILGLQGETLSEGHLQTRQAQLAEFFQALTPPRVVIEVGTHSAWVQAIIAGEGHEVRVANPRQMGSKRRKRKNERIDRHKLARLRRVDPQSLHPIAHRRREVRQDLVLLRTREALVAARTELINTTRGLVKSMGARLRQCSVLTLENPERFPEVRNALLPLVQLAECEQRAQSCETAGFRQL
jgi:hypothetical protein